MTEFQPPLPPPPPSEPTSVTSTKPTNLWQFLDSMGDDAKVRPEPRLSTALSGLAGLLLTLGWTGLLSGDSGSMSGLYAGAITAFGAALAIRLKANKNADLQAAAIGAGITSLLVFCIGFINDTGMNAGLGLILASVLHVAVWALPGFRGRSIFLGFAALALIFGLSSALGGEVLTNDRCEELYYEGGYGDLPDECYEDNIYSDLPGSVGNYLGQQGVIYLIAGTALVLGVATLDRRGYKAVGTALIPAGMVAILSGALLMAVRMANAGAGILAAFAGLALCYVGSRGDRRAMTWWGAAMTTIGVAGFFLGAFTPDTSTATAFAIIAAGGILALTPYIIKKAAENKTVSNTMTE